MTYADWYEQSRSNDHKERAREYLQKYVTSAGSQGRRLRLREGGQRQAVRARAAPRRRDSPARTAHEARRSGCESALTTPSALRGAVGYDLLCGDGANRLPTVGSLRVRRPGKRLYRR